MGDKLEDSSDGVVMFGITIILIAIFGLGVTIGALLVNPYRSGQIDAINGNIIYELREMDNGEMKWRRIEGE